MSMNIAQLQFERKQKKKQNKLHKRVSRKEYFAKWE